MPSPYRAVNTFHLGYKNQSVYAVSGTSRCLFRDPNKTHEEYAMGNSTHFCYFKYGGIYDNQWTSKGLGGVRNGIIAAEAPVPVQ